MDGKTLFEGLFSDGEKHGPYRTIEMSAESPLVTITEGIYNHGKISTFAQTLVHVVYKSEKYNPPKRISSLTGP